MGVVAPKTNKQTIPLVTDGRSGQLLYRHNSPPPATKLLTPDVRIRSLLCGESFLERQRNSCCTLVAECLQNVENSECRIMCRTAFETSAHLADGKGINFWRGFTYRKFQKLLVCIVVCRRIYCHSSCAA
jgi:hypothetical protein